MPHHERERERLSTGFTQIVLVWSLTGLTAVAGWPGHARSRDTQSAPSVLTRLATEAPQKLAGSEFGRPTAHRRPVSSFERPGLNRRQWLRFHSPVAIIR